MEMQENLEDAIDDINAFIKHYNRTNQVSTPHCHTAIIRRRGRKGGYKINDWKALHDGVHGTKATIQAWADSIGAAIRLNTASNLDSDDDFRSPKRSWKRQKSQQ